MTILEQAFENGGRTHEEAVMRMSELQDGRAPSDGRRGTSWRPEVPLQGSVVPVPAQPPLPRTARELLHRGGRELEEARRTTDPADRFTHAHLGALRLAGAMIAARHPGGRGLRGRTAWQLLSAAAPELSRWSAFFAAGAPVRAAIEGGGGHAVSPGEALEWLAAAEAFDDEVRLVLSGAERDVVAGPQDVGTLGPLARAS